MAPSNRARTASARSARTDHSVRRNTCSVVAGSSVTLDKLSTVTSGVSTFHSHRRFKAPDDVTETGLLYRTTPGGHVCDAAQTADPNTELGCDSHAAAARAETDTTSDARRPSRLATSPRRAAAMKQSRRRLCLVELAGTLRPLPTCCRARVTTCRAFASS